jgi:ubiquinone/menaquinone biosynthesis C-methylase UbiE
MNHVLDKRARKLFNRIEIHLPENGTALDIGCGTGHNAQVIRQNTALNVTESDVENIKTTPPPPVLFNGNSLPFKNDSFQCSLMLFVLHYSENPVTLLREAKRVTSGNLIIIQSTYSGIFAYYLLKARDWLQGIFAFYVARFAGLVSNCPCPLYPKTFMKRDILKQIFQEAGWKIIYFEKNGWPLVKVSRDLYVLERV